MQHVKDPVVLSSLFALFLLHTSPPSTNHYPTYLIDTIHWCCYSSVEDMSENTDSKIDAGDIEKAIFNEIPLPHERHPNNFLSYFGEVLARYRRSLPREMRSASNFGKHILGPYFGQPVDRNRISRAEKGDTSVTFGVYAAYLHEMGALPDILWALEGGRSGSLRYLLLVEEELAPQIQKAMIEANEKLSARAEQEKNR